MRHPLHQFLYCPLCGEKAFVAHNFKAKRCEACGFIYYFNPSSAVAAFIRGGGLGGEDRLLVVRRAAAPAAGTLDLPGGFVDALETAEEALLREVYEETGLCVPSPRYLFSLPNLYPYSGFDVHTLDMFFECHLETGIEGMEAGASDDVSESFYLPLPEVRPEDFGLTSVRKAVARYLGMCGGIGGGLLPARKGVAGGGVG
jgi:8-oxo-dGTP pyrophosphatase MutT (NUDIX family)